MNAAERREHADRVLGLLGGASQNSVAAPRRTARSFARRAAQNTEEARRVRAHSQRTRRSLCVARHACDVSGIHPFAHLHPPTLPNQNHLKLGAHSCPPPSARVFSSYSAPKLCGAKLETQCTQSLMPRCRQQGCGRTKNLSRPHSKGHPSPQGAPTGGAGRGGACATWLNLVLTLTHYGRRNFQLVNSLRHGQVSALKRKVRRGGGRLSPVEGAQGHKAHYYHTCTA